MNRHIVSSVGIVVLGAAIGWGAAAHAQPVGSWSCNAVSGNVAIPQQLYATGTMMWKFKGLGWATNCDNTGNSGDPVVAASFKFRGWHSGPNTCPASAGPSYYAKLRVTWYYFNSSNNTVGWVNTMYYNGNGSPMTYVSGPCPGPFTATVNQIGGYPAGPTVTLSGTQVNPSCATTAIQCASAYPTGFAGYSYGSPGFLSVP
ncbi:hypothetical protein L6Q96_11130 [Candidatus Binatia bacterium]|nr:hypothetical protein [Candidatus Binatia bacterium]